MACRCMFSTQAMQASDESNFYVVLPDRPDNFGALNDRELESVTGGFAISAGAIKMGG